MNELSKKLIFENKKRNTKKEKEEFIQELSSKYDCTFHQNKSGGIRNIIIGDLNNAKVIYTTSYDTPTISQSDTIPFPESKLLHFLTIGAKIIFLLFLIMIPVLIFCFGMETSNFYFLVFFLPIMLFSNSQAKHTKNTSGVATLIELIDKMDDEDKKNCAFVFFDASEYYRIGSKIFYKAHKELLDSKLVVNLDGTGTGENILFTYKKENESYVENLNPYFENLNNLKLQKKEKFRRHHSDHLSFKNSVCISTASHTKIFGNFINKDMRMPSLVELYTNNVEQIAIALCEYQKGLNDN